jgi:hypothetical protein
LLSKKRYYACACCYVVTHLHVTPTNNIFASSFTLSTARVCHMSRVGQNRISAPYMAVHFVMPLPKIPYMHRSYIHPHTHTYTHTHTHTCIWLWPTLHTCYSTCICYTVSYSVLLHLQMSSPTPLLHMSSPTPPASHEADRISFPPTQRRCCVIWFRRLAS